MDRSTKSFSSAKDHLFLRTAFDLYDTGNYDAMSLAGLIADDARMTKKDLQRWVEKAYAGALPGATVPWVAWPFPRIGPVRQ